MTETISHNNLYSDLTNIIGNDLAWKKDEKHDAMLSHFARDKKEKVLTTLEQEFTHAWDKKSVKKAPKTLIHQLGDLGVVTKEQLIFSLPATEKTPAIAAIWWPWGHGGTYSLRLLALESDYVIDEVTEHNLWQKIIRIFK